MSFTVTENPIGSGNYTYTWDLEFKDWELKRIHFDPRWSYLRKQIYHHHIGGKRPTEWTVNHGFCYKCGLKFPDELKNKLKFILEAYDKD